MTNTIEAGDGLVRLPLWVGLEEQQERVIDTIAEAPQTLQVR